MGNFRSLSLWCKCENDRNDSKPKQKKSKWKIINRNEILPCLYVDGIMSTHLI